MKISFLFKSSFDSTERQEINVQRIDDANSRLRAFGITLQIFLHKIRTETLHQRRLTNKHECKVILSSSKFSKISFKQSSGRRRAILFSAIQKKNNNKYIVLGQLIINNHNIQE